MQPNTTASDGGVCCASQSSSGASCFSQCLGQHGKCQYEPLLGGRRRIAAQHSSQTEMPEQPEPEQPKQPEPEAEQPRDKPEPESHPEDSSSQPEQEKSGPEPQSKSPETEEELLLFLLSPPPVFADCSHYNATPMTSRRRERRRARVSVWTVVT